MNARVTNRFLSKLHVEPLPGGKARLTAHLDYIDPWGKIIMVPRGFETDFASVPSLARFGVIAAAMFQLFTIDSAWWYLAELFAFWVIFVSEWLENRDSDEAAVVHDFLYTTQTRPRFVADMILFSALDARGAPYNPLWKRLLFLINVRIFGFIPWHDDKSR